MATELGLRERKKRRTRALIADTARRLFAERGFDQVPVAEVARAADVSVATVFNCFPTKEDLVYGRLEAFEQEMLDAIRDRPPGEPIVDAFERFVLRPRGLLASDSQPDAEFLTAITKMIAQSDTPAGPRPEIHDRYTQALAELITTETGAGPNDIEPWVIANALIGVHPRPDRHHPPRRTRRHTPPAHRQTGRKPRANARSRASRTGSADCRNGPPVPQPAWSNRNAP